MRQLTKFFPGFCSRLKIFLCYAHEDRHIADEISQTLTNSGHDVFMDVSKLKAGGDFNEAIRRAIAGADRFIFIISKASVAAGKFTLTELNFAQERWPSPVGAVFPVQVDPAVDVASLPAYLRLIQVQSVKGNAAAEVADVIEKSRAVRPRYLAAAAMLLAVVAGFPLLRYIDGKTSFRMDQIRQVDFRPYLRPGDVADSLWVESPLRVTVKPIKFFNEGQKTIQVDRQTVSLPIAGKVALFHSANEVDLKPDGVGCDDRWLCSKGIADTKELGPRGEWAREIMFQESPVEAVTYGDLVRSICTTKDDWLELTVATQARAIGMLGGVDVPRSAGCKIALKPWQKENSKTTCDPTFKPRRRNIVFNCQ